MEGGGGVKHGIDSEFKPEFDGRLKWQTVAFDTTEELNRCRPLWLKYVPSLMITGSSVLSGAVSPSELQSGLTSNSEEKMFFKALEVSSLPTSKSVSSCTFHRSGTACSLRLLSSFILGEVSTTGDVLVLYLFIIFLIELAVFFVELYFRPRQLDF